MNVTILERTLELEEFPVAIAAQKSNLIRPTSPMVGSELSETIMERFEPFKLDTKNIDRVLKYAKEKIIPASNFRLPVIGKTCTRKPSIYIYARYGKKMYFLYCRITPSYGKKPGLYELSTSGKISLYPSVARGTIIIAGKKSPKK